MHRAALILLLTALSAFTKAQSTCPVGLFAERESGLTLERASDAVKTGPSQGLHVTLHRTGTPAIVSIEATLHGFSPDSQILPIAAHPDRDVTRKFHLQRRAGEETLTSFDVSMSQVGGLRWVDVTSITYADKTTWQSPQAALCRATPSLFTLIAGS